MLFPNCGKKFLFMHFLLPKFVPMLLPIMNASYGMSRIHHHSDKKSLSDLSMIHLWKLSSKPITTTMLLTKVVLYQTIQRQVILLCTFGESKYILAY